MTHAGDEELESDTERWAPDATAVDRAAFDAFVASRLAPYRTGGRLTLPSARNVVVARR